MELSEPKTSDARKADSLPVEDVRTGLSVKTLKRAFADNLFYAQGKFPAIATPNDFYMASAYTIRDRLLHHWINTIETYLKGREPKIVCYLSAEFLLGPQLGNNLINLGIYEEVRRAVAESGLDLKDLLQQEEEPGLGNGGLGRLAACYMDSLSSLEIPAIGYGIRYEFGIFDQESGMVGRSKSPISGCATVILGKYLDRRLRWRSSLVGTLKPLWTIVDITASAGFRLTR